MSKVRFWKPGLNYYEDLIGIECARREGVDRLIEALCGRDLRTCPHDIENNTVVIPKSAVKFLPLKEIKHKKIELRHVISLSSEVNQELNRRYIESSAEPHYYTCGTGFARTVCKMWVVLSTVKAIDKLLKKKN